MPSASFRELHGPHLCPRWGCLASVPAGAFACASCAPKLTPEERASLAEVGQGPRFAAVVRAILLRLRTSYLA